MDDTDFPLFGRKQSKKPSGEDTLELPPPITSVPSRLPLISRPTDEEFYRNNHSHNGVAVILNHKYVKGMKSREGTEKDCKSIAATLASYGFDVRVYNELKHEQVRARLKEVAAEDHSQNDCFVLVIMTHGEEGKVCASDISYPVEELWQPFLGDKCATLIDKPKIFFVQACRGNKFDNPTTFRIQWRSTFSSSLMPTSMTAHVTYAIPSTADILVMYATFDKHYSFRNVDHGSWFIQSLSSVMNAAAERYESRTEGLELLKLLTAVNRKVAYEYQTYALTQDRNEKKEMPNFMSTLTKTFHLKVKPIVSADGLASPLASTVAPDIDGEETHAEYQLVYMDSGADLPNFLDFVRRFPDA